MKSFEKTNVSLPLFKHEMTLNIQSDSRFPFLFIELGSKER